MSGFCGFIGQSDNAVFLNMINCIKHESVYEPICFDDGYIQFAYVPYLASEMERIGHNQSFTVWVMIEAGYDSDELLVQNIIDEYGKKGMAFAEELKGTFSIVLWDGEKKRLYLLRDRYGSKPLYYAKSKSGIVFETEIRAILQHGDVKKTINYAAVYQYLSYQSVFFPDTAYEEILHISAGSYGTYAHGKFEEIRYAMLPFGVHTEDGYEEAAEKIEVLLKEKYAAEISSNRLNYANGSLKVAIELTNEQDNKYEKLDELYRCYKKKDMLKAMKQIEQVSFKDDETYNYLSYLFILRIIDYDDICFIKRN